MSKSANQETAARIPDAVRHFMIEESRGRCSMCKEEVGVLDIHHMKLVSQGGLSTYPNLIALCPNCHRIAHKLGIPLKALRRLKEAWVSVCRAEDDALSATRHSVDETIREARLLSFSPALDDLLRAEAILEIVLSRVDPLNVEAAVLLKKISKLLCERDFPDEHMYSIASQFVPAAFAILWVAFCLWIAVDSPFLALGLAALTPATVVFSTLQVVLVHELGHAVGLYLVLRKRVPLGERIRFRKAFKHIELNLSALVSISGFLNALRGKFPPARINMKNLYRDWVSEVYDVGAFDHLWAQLAARPDDVRGHSNV